VEYYRHGNVDLRMAGPYLRPAFGLFVVVHGVSLIFGAVRRLGWI
jgi:hypothetical protein